MDKDKMYKLEVELTKNQLTYAIIDLNLLIRNEREKGTNEKALEGILTIFKSLCEIKENEDKSHEVL